MGFVLIQDDDCHWYVCPADKQAEAEAHFAAVIDYWDNDARKDREPPMPDWLVRVGGAPCRVKFPSYAID